MHDLPAHAITVFMGFFAIMNPIANAPIFVGLTEDLPRAATKRIAAQATSLAFIIVATFSIGGHLLFRAFGISLSAFQVAGGILVFLVGRHLLGGQATSPMHTPRKLTQPSESGAPAADAAGHDSDRALSISPLAVPILAGPGTIACAINFSSGRPISQVLTTVGVFAVLCFTTYLVFIFGQTVLKRLGPYTLGVLGRLMGLILAVIGVQMIFDGLSAQFPHLFR